MANRKRKIGERWFNSKGLRVREGKRGRTYQFKVTSPKGIKWQTCSSEAEALRLRDIERAKLHDGTFVLNSKTSVKKFMNTWIDNLTGIKHITKERYQIHLEHINLGIGDVQLQKLEPYMIQSFINNLTALDRGDKRELKPLGDRTKGFVLSTLTTALENAVKNNLIPSNPCNDVKPPKGIHKYKGKRPLGADESFIKGVHVLSPNDANEILELLKPHYETWLACFLLWNTGLRRGEACALKWSNFVKASGKIWIHETANDAREVTDPKTELSQGWVSLRSEVTDVLAHHQEMQANDAKLIHDTPASSEWFILGDPKEPTLPLRPGTLGQRLKYFLKGTRYANITPHEFRHAHASSLLANGMNPVSVASRLREKVDTLLSTYAHALVNKDDGDILEKALAASSGNFEKSNVVDFKK